jgi:hypothetical protein
MSASPKPFVARAAFPALQNLPLPEIDSFRATVFDTIRFARFTLRGQMQKPVDMASALLPQALAAPMRDATRFGFKVGDAVEQAVGQTVHSLKDRLLPEEETVLSPLEAGLFNRLLQARGTERQSLSKSYVRYFSHHVEKLLASFGIDNYLLMERGLQESFFALCGWLDQRDHRRVGYDSTERIFGCAAACVVELVHAAPLKVMDEPKFDIPILGDRGLQTYVNQLVFGYLCHLTAMCNLDLDPEERNLAFISEVARNDVIGEFTSLISATCLPDPQEAVANFFLRRFRMSPVGARMKPELRHRIKGL